MGLDAIVRCNCYREGRTMEPPVPRELIEVGEDGWVGLTVPFDGNEELYKRFDDWTSNACEHEDMDYASERIANWWGYRSFQAALESAGIAKFPTLAAQLPEGNGGTMAAAAAAKALAELELFASQQDAGVQIALIESETGDVLQEHHRDTNPIFIWARGEYEVGMDGGGLFVIAGSKASEPGRVLFRARRIEQRVLQTDPENRDRPNLVEYVDLETGGTFRGDVAISKQVLGPEGQRVDEQGRVYLEYPRLLHVEQRVMPGAHFEYIIKALTTVFRAALATGNPVVWC